MEYILIYSDKCNFSNQLKQYNIFNKLSKIVVNNKSDLNKIPEYVKEVPVLIIKNTIKKEINILKKIIYLNGLFLILIIMLLIIIHIIIKLIIMNLIC